MTIVIAHRGASVARPENTIEAFQEARRLGADMVELDARRTADGTIAVRHDPEIPGSGALITLHRHELTEEVPTLGAALDACVPMQVNVEIKNSPFEPDWDPDQHLAAAVVELVAARGARDAVLVSSFNLEAIDRCRGLDPAIATAWLTLAGWDQAAAVATCAERGHAAVHPHDPAVTPELIARAHDAGVAVNVWTVDDPARMAQLAEWGVDGICTNDPALLLRVLGRPSPD